MKKIISFSIWGSSSCYLNTSLKNILLRRDHFPEWELVFYIGKDVDPKLIKAISEDEYCSFVDMSNYSNCSKNSLWRFNSFFSKDIVISRDCDSLLIPRDFFCVNEWLKSDKDFHIIRDHPKHTDKILAGMFGCRNGAFNKYKETMLDFLKQKLDWGCDQYFLGKYIYPNIVDNSFIHSCNTLDSDLGYGIKIDFKQEEFYIDSGNIKKRKWGYIGQRQCKSNRFLSVI